MCSQDLCYKEKEKEKEKKGNFQGQSINQSVPHLITESLNQYSIR